MTQAEKQELLMKISNLRVQQQKLNARLGETTDALEILSRSISNVISYIQEQEIESN